MIFILLYYKKQWPGENQSIAEMLDAQVNQEE
jgi:hypothetical protein